MQQGVGRYGCTQGGIGREVYPAGYPARVASPATLTLLIRSQGGPLGSEPRTATLTLLIRSQSGPSGTESRAATLTLLIRSQDPPRQISARTATLTLLIRSQRRREAVQARWARRSDGSMDPGYHRAGAPGTSTSRKEEKRAVLTRNDGKSRYCLGAKLYGSGRLLLPGCYPIFHPFSPVARVDIELELRSFLRRPG